MGNATWAAHQLYKNVFTAPVTAPANSKVIFCPDFNQLEFTLQAGVVSDINTVSGAFVIGEEVTGGNSGATGQVVSITDSTIVIGNVTGTFTDGETITGGTSGATAVLDTPTAPDFLVNLFVSNQDINNPPDPSMPSSPTNQYSQIAYSDGEGGVNYDSAHQYNPSADTAGAYGQKVFRAGIDGQWSGAVWIFLTLSSVSGGALEQSDIDLFNN